MFTYKMNVLEELKNRGYTTYRIRKEKLLSEKYVQALRRGELVSMGTYDKLCELLHCDLGDIITHVDQTTIDDLLQ